MELDIKEIQRNVHRIKFTLKGFGIEYAQTLCIMSDLHWDNPYCNRQLLKKHLDHCLEKKIPVAIIGDLFCVMQGKYDPRSSKDDIREEHQRGDYLDAVVRTAVEWFKPYKDILFLITPGNHESSILKRMETDLIDRLVQGLKQEGAKHIHKGGYSGWIAVQINYANSNHSAVKKIWYHHGYGGGAPVTKGTIQTARQQNYVRNADILVNGHIHNSWFFPIEGIELSQKMKVRHVRTMHVRTPGYKEEYDDGYGGWHIERGGAPKPNGSALFDFHLDRKRRDKVENTQCEIEYRELR